MLSLRNVTLFFRTRGMFMKSVIFQKTKASENEKVSSAP